jgi:hypothetical protein
MNKSTKKAAATLPLVRCAIYTRKSTEEGLEQEFNSLDAQREAGEAFVASQRAEGWTCLPDRYDDGGFTGGPRYRRVQFVGRRSGSRITMACITEGPLGRAPGVKTHAKDALFGGLPLVLPTCQVRRQRITL